jgi:hypothetical protein
METPDSVKRVLDNQEQIHRQDRDVLFENEKFLIGVLQVVSGGSIVAALSQSDQLTRIASAASFRWFLTLACISLLVAIAAAFFKHQYKMWDVKTLAVNPLENFTELTRRLRLTGRYLNLMRFCLGLSFAAISINLIQIVVAVWLH